MGKTFLKYLFATLIACIGILLFLAVQPIFRVPEPEISPHVDTSKLETHVRVLSEELHPRCFDHQENLEQVVRYIEKYFVMAGGRVSIQTFLVDGVEYHNVIASFGPEEGPVIVVGAHYDSYGVARRKPVMDTPGAPYGPYGETSWGGGLYTPGADDNASGVAGLLALADLLGKHPPKKQVQLVAYSLEEPPFFGTQSMGSAAHATALHENGMSVSAMISLEMIGFFSDVEGSQTYPAEAMGLLYPKKGNFIAVVGRFQDMFLTRTVKAAMLGASDLPVYSMNAVPLIPGIDFSDHRNYWPYGYEAVMITDTAFYRNFAYHTMEDTADRLDYDRMGKVVQGVFAAINALARASL